MYKKAETLGSRIFVLFYQDEGDGLFVVGDCLQKYWVKVITNIIILQSWERRRLSKLCKLEIL